MKNIIEPNEHRLARAGYLLGNPEAMRLIKLQIARRRLDGLNREICALAVECKEKPIGGQSAEWIEVAAAAEDISRAVRDAVGAASTPAPSHDRTRCREYGYELSQALRTLADALHEQGIDTETLDFAGALPEVPPAIMSGLVQWVDDLHCAADGIRFGFGIAERVARLYEEMIYDMADENNAVNAVIAALFLGEEVTSEEHLARLTELPLDTVVRILDDLKADGLIQPEPPW